MLFFPLLFKAAAFISCKSLFQHLEWVDIHQRRAIVWARCFRSPLSLLCRFYGATTTHPPICHTIILYILTLQVFPIAAEDTGTKNLTIETFPILKHTFLFVRGLLQNSKSIGFASVHQNLFPFPRNLLQLDKIYDFLSSSLY